jgi:hypothetical protein
MDSTPRCLDVQVLLDLILRKVSLMFMRVNARCAHHVRPPLDRGPVDSWRSGSHGSRLQAAEIAVSEGSRAWNVDSSASRVLGVQIRGTQPTVFGVVLGGCVEHSGSGFEFTDATRVVRPCELRSALAKSHPRAERKNAVIGRRGRESGRLCPEVVRLAPSECASSRFSREG